MSFLVAIHYDFSCSFDLKMGLLLFSSIRIGLFYESGMKGI